MYDLELGQVVAHINRKKAKRVCIQLPDGLKPKAQFIQRYIEKNTTSRVFIWGGSCFGSCDIPLEIKSLGIDLLIQWGHSEWR
ncbi:diphthamide synthesis protein [Candidatus Woesearchaeota archaeon]|nr:diphthamide synthesis protein [Candidatus Woesearchaeota archaeon]